MRSDIYFFKQSKRFKNQNFKSLAAVAGESMKPLFVSVKHSLTFWWGGQSSGGFTHTSLRSRREMRPAKKARFNCPKSRSYARPSTRCASSKSLTSTFLPRAFLAVVSSPRSQQHLSSSTFKCFNLRESQYPPREQAELLSRGQFETEYLNTLPASICWQLHQRNIHQQVQWTDLNHTKIKYESVSAGAYYGLPQYQAVALSFLFFAIIHTTLVDTGQDVAGFNPC